GERVWVSPGPLRRPAAALAASLGAVWLDGDAPEDGLIDVLITDPAGPPLEGLLDAVAEGGRVVLVSEAEPEVPVSALRRGVSLSVVRPQRRLTQRPDLADRALSTWAALHPAPETVQPWTFSEIEAALQAPSGGRCLVPDPRPRVIRRPRAARPRTDGVVLITGGLGALGLAAARWLASRGVRNFALVGRGAPSAAASEELAALAASGAEVTVHRCDVADREALQALLASITATRPLRGVVHAAGVLDDALLADQSLARLEAVARPKVVGAWNLHTLTLGMDLDLFVLYSSAAAVLGSPAQANYVAANAVLDALARHRHHLGLPGLALGWGAFADAGLAAAGAAELEARGLGLLTRAKVEPWMERLLGSAAPALTPCPLSPRRLFEASPALAAWPYLSRLHDAPGDAPRSAAWAEALAGLQGEALGQRVLTLVMTSLGQVLRADPARLDPHAPFKQLGVDSLLGLELRGRIEGGAGVSLPTTAVWTWPSPAALAAEVTRLISPSLPPTPAAPEPDAARFEALDDEALLAAALARLDDLPDDPYEGA
ncbi:beta-ketoacyl reductase, partial [Myxococcota bacterium]|nr:beta-ketoacyl reductase [Myxococcota bacterium]